MTPRRRRRGLFPALASLAATLLLAGPATSQSEAFSEVEGVKCTARCAWPNHVNRGYLPVSIDLYNTSGQRREVRIRGSMTFSSGMDLTTGVDLEPGQHARLDVLAPAWSPNNWGWSQANYQFEVRAGGGRGFLNGIGAQEYVNQEMRAVAYVARGRLEAAEIESLSAEIASHTVVTETVWTNNAAEEKTAPNVSLSSVVFEELPPRYEAYTSLDTVIVDVRRGLPEPRDLEPLLEWVRVGGKVAFLGAADAMELLSSVPSASGWLEPRFLVREFNGAAAYRCGLGRLLVRTPNAGAGTAAVLPSIGEARGMKWLLDEPCDWVPSFRPESNARRNQVEIPGLGDLPYRMFTFLLIVFALVIGPVNFVLVKRSGRPGLLLLTIPGIAFATAGALLMYGIFYQGIDVKSAASTVSVLDTRTNRASTAEIRELFVGLTPGPGLQPGLGTAVLPDVWQDQFRNSEYRFRIEQGSTLRLSGDFLPARRAVDQVLLTERNSRLRLDLAREGTGFRATNGLDATVRELWLVDPNGDGFWLDQHLLPGGDGALSPVPGDASPLPPELEGALGLVPGSWLARVDANPLRDDCGVETNELLGRHWILGVLPLDGETWK